MRSQQKLMQVPTLARLSGVHAVYKPQLSIMQQCRCIAGALLSEISDMPSSSDTGIHI